jgi:hypothetical protein
MSGVKCGGQDTNDDGIPDLPLRYEFGTSDTVVQFPLGFCPGSPETNFVNLTGTCPGSWGIVVKEWKIFTAVSIC